MNDPELFESLNLLSGRDSDDFSQEFEDEIGKISGRCIDIGSGPGDTVIKYILPKLNPEATIVCSDISEAMVNFGKKKYKGNNRVSFLKLDIESANVPKDLIEHFHHVTSFYCLHWCQDMQQVFENIFDLLRPGGTALLSFLANFPSNNAYPVLGAMPKYQPYVKNAERYVPVFQHSKQPRKDLKALVKEVGFEVHHCSVRENNYTFDSPDVLRRFLLAINPFIGQIPENLKEEYGKDLLEIAMREHIILNKNNNNKNDECKILCMYRVFLVYLKKPLQYRH